MGGILLLTGCLPLLFNPRASAPFEPPKAVALIIVAALVIIVHLATQRPKISHKPLVWLVVALGAVYILSAVLAPNRSLAFIGDANRHGALTTLSALAIYLVVATRSLTTKKIESIFIAATIGSIPVCLYGLLQATGNDFIQWESDAVSGVMGTLGRANFLAAYLCTIIPLTLYIREIYPVLKIQTTIALILQLACLLLTRSRAGWIAFTLSLLVFFTLRYLLNRQMRPALISLLTILSLSTLLYTATNRWFNPTTITPPTSTAIPFDDIRTESVNRRLLIWQNTLTLIPEAGLLGFGPEQYTDAFAEKYPTGTLFDGRDSIINDPHNIFLHTLTDIGYLGTLLLLTILTLTAYQIYIQFNPKNFINSKNSRSNLLPITLLSSLTATLTQAQFNPDTIVTTYLLWLLLALATQNTA